MVDATLVFLLKLEANVNIPVVWAKAFDRRITKCDVLRKIRLDRRLMSLTNLSIPHS